MPAQDFIQHGVFGLQHFLILGFQPGRAVFSVGNDFAGILLLFAQRHDGLLHFIRIFEPEKLLHTVVEAVDRVLQVGSGLELLNRLRRYGGGTTQ
ncbi:MAG: hypothetical protein QM813_21355 [Verrucomicrobiota bacterium]